jgi:hypothetical protein
MLGMAMCGAFAMTVWQPTALQADVATKTGDKPKKDREDKKTKEKNSEYLPEARPAAVRFTMGQAVEVQLVAAVGSLRQMEFVIRQMTKNGTLSAIRPDPREGHKGLVTYTHHGGDAPLVDSFTYSCRLEGGSWSAPATVTLTGGKLEPKIEIVKLSQFNRVFLGGESSARVTVRNSGGADFHADLQWPEPFTGPPTLDVPRGGTAEFAVFARPIKTGDFRHELVLQPGVKDSSAIFYVVCVQALSVSPSRLVLVAEGNEGERSGVLSLANARAQPVRVVMKHPARLLAPEETEVAAESRSDLRITLPPGDVEAFTGEIVVVAGEDVQKVMVEAGAKPAILQVLVPASLKLDFGMVEQRTSPSREVVLSNGGGRPLIVEARTHPPYSLGDAPKSIRLEPRAQARLKIALLTDRVGLAPGELFLDSNASRLTVSLGADVREGRAVMETPATSEAMAHSAPPSTPAARSVAASSTGNPDGARASRTESLSLMAAVVASKGLPIPRSMINPYLPSISSIEFISAKSTELTIAWPKPSMMPSGWLIETASQVLEPNSGIFVKAWQRHRDWETVEVDGNRIAARMFNLAPAALYEVRVLAVDREGKVSEPLVTKLVQTNAPWRVPPWVWRTLIAVGLAALTGWLYRGRNGNWRLKSA